MQISYMYIIPILHNCAALHIYNVACSYKYKLTSALSFWNSALVETANNTNGHSYATTNLWKILLTAHMIDSVLFSVNERMFQNNKSCM